eukprot:1709181-Rhodomonas_salina.2
MGTTEYDPNFEFNAPKVPSHLHPYHDFTNPADDDGADAWFDNLDSSLQDETMGSAAPVTGAAPQEASQVSDESKMEGEEKKMEESDEKKMEEAEEADTEPDSTAEDPAESAMNISVDPSAMAASNEEAVEQPADDGDVLAAYTGAAAPQMEEDAASPEEAVAEPEEAEATTEVAPAAEEEHKQEEEVEQQHASEDEHAAEDAPVQEEKKQEQEQEQEQENNTSTSCASADAQPPVEAPLDASSSSLSAADALCAAPEEGAAKAVSEVRNRSDFLV